MQFSKQFRQILLQLGAGMLALAAIFSTSDLTAQSSHPVEKIIHTFEGYDGEIPYPLAADHDGNLYGSTEAGGSSHCLYGCGLVFKLTRPANPADPWGFSVIFEFDGTRGVPSLPQGTLTLDSAGNVYGATGVANDNGGAVFRLSPSTVVGAPWTMKVLSVGSPQDEGGWGPSGRLIFDSAGNLYGTTMYGGEKCGCGTVFELSPTPSGPWTRRTIHKFKTRDGRYPNEGLTFDRSGALYGTTVSGAGTSADGTVFQMKRHDGQWTLRTLYRFNSTSDGINAPSSGLVLDGSGNLYGTASGPVNGGVFEISPSSDGNVPWTEQTLYVFNDALDGSRPLGNLLIDKNTNLYGTASEGGFKNAYRRAGTGAIFRLSPPVVTGGTWEHTTLYDFAPGANIDPDGCFPFGGLVEVHGKFYGDAVTCGAGDQGAIFSLTIP